MTGSPSTSDATGRTTVPTAAPPATAAGPGAGWTRHVEDPRVGVVVMSRDRRDELLVTLRRHAAPVVLVDNASSDGTTPAVRAAVPDVTVLPLPENVGAHARTLGAQAVGTPYVAFADDDSWWAPGSLRVAADWLDAHPEVAVVQAHILVGAEERPDSFCEVLAASPLPRPAGVDRPVLLGFIACAAMVRRDAFLAVGGFDDVVRFPGEEERLSLDLAARGWSIAYLDAATVHHHPSPRRSDPASRQAAIVRSALLTALMRLPWRRVLRRVAEALRDPAGRVGLRRALPDVRRALARRRVVPGHVRELLAVLDAPDA
ncbi:glycosyltransferase family 2 protein [Cellulomonas sp. NPDC057328]|uniref:glycosyltransferase family 2 protein n=1 Tax=Cellulomonas sp. NPDC057328 TaxID=3346101 RepID=UPI003630E2A0